MKQYIFTSIELTILLQDVIIDSRNNRFQKKDGNDLNRINEYVKDKVEELSFKHLK